MYRQKQTEKNSLKKIFLWYKICSANFAVDLAQDLLISAILAVFARCLPFWLADCHYGQPIGSASTKEG
jgi:hypothetical protein